MKLLEFPENVPEEKCALTIGFFDGVHLGHQHLLQKLKDTGLPTVVATFEDSPRSILYPEKPTTLLCSFPEKIHRLSLLKVDYTYILPSNRVFLAQTYAHFLKNLQQYVPFRHMVFGKGATFGKNQEGSEEKVGKLGKLWGISVDYVSPFKLEGEIVSSTKIRTLLAKNSPDQAENFY